MAEDSDDKTEPATSKRIEDAREKGQVPHSRELLTFAVLLAGVSGLSMMGSGLVGALRQVMQYGMGFSRAQATEPGAMWEMLSELLIQTMLQFLPLLGLLVVTVVVSSVMISGWLLSPKAFQFNFERMSPLGGIKRMFSTSSVVEASKALLKSLLIGGVAALVMWNERGEFYALVDQVPSDSMAQMAQILVHTFLWVVGSMVVLVLIDVPFQLWQYAKSLRMTKDEVRREMKEQDGDPQIKARVRQIQREMARRRMMEQVPKADVIVTNPTHYAVALQYTEGRMKAPTVVAKGAALVAERIVGLGREARVPVMRTPPFARALYFHAELGEEIPATLYTAAAEVLAYVYQLKVFEQAGGDAPEFPEQLPVPAALDPETRHAPQEN